VREFVLAQPGAGEYLDLIDQLLEFSIPAFADEGKSRLTIGIGCTGGRHRSIVFAEELAQRLCDEGHDPVEVFHRELGRK
ncbi:MAG: RNase adaptor protein RapZ, partial [Chloroflexi bacterium]